MGQDLIQCQGEILRDWAKGEIGVAVWVNQAVPLLLAEIGIYISSNDEKLHFLSALKTRPCLYS